MRKTCYLRDVEDSDRELLFQWANDAVTRSQSFSQAPITWEEHAAWFARTRADKGCLHWILMAADETGKTPQGTGADAAHPAGVLRLVKDADGSECRISYSIAPECRGRGYGTAVLELAKAWAAAYCPRCVRLYGEVKAENTASVRCFEKAGYEMAAGGTAGAEQTVLCFAADLAQERVLYFRADGGAQIGSGHLMRCFTIADACRMSGLLPVFVAADAEAEHMALERGYPCRILNTDYREMDSEFPVLLPILRNGAPVVLDSYFLTESYVNALRKAGHPVVWMDDLAGQQLCVDMLINYNLYAGLLDYTAERGVDGCLMLLGPSYAPVRPSFRGIKLPAGECIRNVLVMTGGSDQFGAGIFFADLLSKLLPDAKRFVVCGPYAQGKEALYALSAKDGNTEVIEGCSDLSDVMRRSDLAIAAAGSTLYELCAVGLPCVVYYMADNQRMGAEAFARETGAVNLGDIRSESFRAAVPGILENALKRLRGASERQRLADRMHALVDGQGAARIAKRLKMLTGEAETQRLRESSRTFADKSAR